MLDIEDHDQLLDYLRTTGRVTTDEVMRVRTLAGGVSNKTVRVDFASGAGWVLKQALAKLRVAVDWFSDPARIEREAEALRHLPTLLGREAVTPLIFEDRAEHVLAMAAVPEPHENWKAMLLRGEVRPEHITQFGRMLGRLHARSYAHRDMLEPAFRDRRFFETLRIEPYYQYTAQQVPEAAAFITRLRRASEARRLTLVHGDYSPKNVLVHDGRLVLLDHEVIHWGDPAFDVGFSLAHLLSKARHLRIHRATFTGMTLTYWIAYRQAAGLEAWSADLEAWCVRQAMGCLLARAAGRSRLEYLDAAARQRQVHAVVALVDDPPDTVTALMDRFLEA